MSFLKKHLKLLLLILALIILGLLTILFLWFKLKTQSTSETKTADSPVSMKQEETDPNAPPLKLKSIGVNLDYYDPATSRAGDFLFTKQKLQFNRVFMPFGFVIPGGNSSTGKDKANPQPTFVVPSGTKVLSLVDGVVAAMPKVWSGDYSIQVSSDGKVQKWLYETEHVINPIVKVGDRVKAGQVLAEVSDFDKGAPPGFGTVEIGILKGGNPPEHVCPFLYLDPSVKQQITTKIQNLFKSWEDYIGDPGLYDETQQIPGCQTLDPIPG